MSPVFRSWAAKSNPRNAAPAERSVDGTAAMLVSAGLVLVAFGAGLAPVVMIGILGLLVVLVGLLLLVIGLTRIREDHGATQLRDGIGRALGILAGFAIAMSALESTSLVLQHKLAARHWPYSHELTPTILILAIALWLLVPSLAVGAIYLRTGWPRRRLAGWWFLIFSSQPAAVLIFIMFAASGAPLTA